MKTPEDLLPPGAEPGTIPTDLDQATGLERLEILGKMQGIDVFDMRPLDASRLGRCTLHFPGNRWTEARQTCCQLFERTPFENSETGSPGQGRTWTSVQA